MKNESWTEKSHLILEQASGLENYNHWLISQFQKYFGKSILEIGSGQGALSKLLPANAIIVLSDIVPEYLKVLRNTFTDPVLDLDITRDTPEDLRGKLDTIFSSNVFEHLENDQAAFDNCYQLLENGGHLLLFIPARPEIFGILDQDMGHYRRYTKKELTTKAANAGFEIIDLYYANLPGYFIWWGRGVLLGKFIKAKSGTGKFDNFSAKLFDRIIAPFLYLEKYLHPPFGQSLVLIAKKTNK